jgi:ABC-2 type transport system ATP-binding protein
MAMVADPEILFLDEPTLGLDPQSRRELWAYIAGLKGGKTIVLTTHYLEEADALADHILIIDRGRKLREGTGQELKESLFARKTMAIKARRVSAASQEALRARYGNLRLTAEGAEITAADIDFDRVVDILRANGEEIEGVSMKEPSLDDVFLELTGKGGKA